MGEVAVSDVVERLAERWGGRIDDGMDRHTHEDDARWWLNAIADELENTERTEWSAFAIDWLRSKAEQS